LGILEKDYVILVVRSRVTALFIDNNKHETRRIKMTLLIDKAKTQEMLDKTCIGWDETWTWSIVNTTVDQEGVYEGTVEELEALRGQLARIIKAIKENKDVITKLEQE